jgi:pyruvate dehydrogenase E2 component (dihydrolipoamide acetyltransferase)
VTRRDFLLPDLGEGLAEAEIVRWLVAPGEQVDLNQPLVEVETAKAAVEIPSPYAGVVQALHCAEGDLVLVGAALLTVAEAPAGQRADAAAPATAAVPAGVAVPEVAVPAGAGQAAGAAVPGGVVVVASPDGPAAADAVAAEEAPALVVGRAPADPPVGEMPRRRPRRPAATASSPAAAVGSVAELVSVVERRSDPRVASPTLARAADGGGRGPSADGATAARVLAAPPVRRLARDLGVDLATVQPTGPDGRIVRADVTAAALPVTAVASPVTAVARPVMNGAAPVTDGAPASAPTVPVGARPRTGPRPGDRIPVRGVARQMALAMERSAFTVPQATVARAVDVTALLDLLARWRADTDAAGPGRITPLAFVARAVVAAVVRHPLANARWLAAVDGSGEIEVHPAVNLGVAVASDRGLVVPVIPRADGLGLPALATELAGLIEAARAGATPPARMRGATITLSNVGVFGVDSAAGLVREGEAALVVLGAIRDTPAVWEGHVQVRKVMEISVSFDHRILDGAAAARFLAEIAAVLTDPPRLLLHG